MSRRYEKWQRWFEEILLDVQSLLSMKHVYYEVVDIIKNNPKIQRPSIFYDFLVTVYASSAVIAVRRQVKNKKDSISLVRLLDELCVTPEDISRARFSVLHGYASEEAHDRLFDRFSGPRKPFIDVALVRADMKKLKALASKCEDYADRQIAHLDKGGVKNPPTYNELNGCIDFIESLLLKYQVLFRKDVKHSFTPTIQAGWKEIFKEPWLGG